MVTAGAAARPLAKRKHRAEVLRHGLEHPGCQPTPHLVASKGPDQMELPPQMTICWPVMAPASGPSRNAAIAATSSGRM